MALILNIETATTVCSVALAKDGELLSLKEINNGYTHSENLTVFIQGLFTGKKYSLSDIDAVAVSKGPGSYTGLRIGVSVAKGLCLALDKPLIGINTLRSMALGLVSDKPLTHNSQLTTYYCPMLDARRMEVYCAVYDIKANEIRKTSAEIIDENSFSDIFKKNQVVFFGDGAAKCKAILSQQPNAVFIENIFPSAQYMIPLSEKSADKKQFEDVAYFEPYYLKDFVADRK